MNKDEEREAAIQFVSDGYRAVTSRNYVRKVQAQMEKEDAD